MTIPHRHPPALVRPTLAIVVVMVAVMGVAAVLGVRMIDALQDLHASATRATEVAAAADTVLDVLQDSETAARGFLLTERPAYLDPYLANRDRLAETLRELDALAADSAALQADLGPLGRHAQATMEDIDRTVEAARASGPQAGLAIVLTDQGRQHMEAVRAAVAHIKARAIAEREDRSDLLMARQREAFYLVLSAALAGVMLLGFSAIGLLIGRRRLSAARSALAVQSQRLQATVDRIRDGVAVFDVGDRLILWNATFFPTTGLPAALATEGAPFARFAAAAAAADWQPPLLAEPLPAGDIAVPPVSGELRVADKVLEIWRGRMPDGGQILAVADISRRVRAEAVARQAQKMEALGQLTGGVAHDFNNLLQVISANLELVDRRLPADLPEAPWIQSRLSSARAGVERGARLIQHLLAFARRQPVAPRAVRPDSVLRGMEDLLVRSIGAKIRISIAAPESAWEMRVDPQQFENAILNLTINARDAIEADCASPPGAIAIGLENATIQPGCAANLGIAPGDYVRVSVTDNGAGMPESVVARATEPFFTTKAEGRGSGLGLPMVYGFARQSGGVMKIDSTPGCGTTVTLIIPRAARPAEGLSSGAAPAFAAAGGTAAD
ncbi:MAG: CHASE3 domain-containing protein [Proteobacteria bacterium]|nr:CHASE3 domain-containing protein [Pseudomonadota bacterium]